MLKNESKIKILKKNTKKKNIDLYSDNNPKDTIKNLGYKN